MKYYAIPSLYAPVLVFSESALENHGPVMAALLRGQSLQLPLSTYTPLLIDKLISAGYTNQLVAPYVIPSDAVAGSALLSKFFIDDTIVAFLLSRSRKYNVLTAFCSDKKNLWVDKHFIDSDGQTIELGNGILAVAEKRQPWLNGEGIERKLETYALLGDWQSFCGLLNSFIRHVCEVFNHDECHISGVALEAIARNCVVESGRFSFFDLEYRSSDPIRKSYFIFRVCYHIFGQTSLLLARSPYENYKNMYEYFCRENGIQCNWHGDINAENNFIKAVALAPRTIPEAELSSVFSLCEKERRNRELKQKIRKLRLFLKIGALIIVVQMLSCLFGQWL